MSIDHPCYAVGALFSQGRVELFFRIRTCHHLHEAGDTTTAGLGGVTPGVFVLLLFPCPHRILCGGFGVSRVPCLVYEVIDR